MSVRDTRSALTMLSLAAAVLCVPAPAKAAIAELRESSYCPGECRGFTEFAWALDVRAGVGERNDLVIARHGVDLVVRDRGAPLSPGERCAAGAAGEVRCHVGNAPVTDVLVAAGDGDDVV